MEQNLNVHVFKRMIRKIYVRRFHGRFQSAIKSGLHAQRWIERRRLRYKNKNFKPYNDISWLTQMHWRPIQNDALYIRTLKHTHIHAWMFEVCYGRMWGEKITREFCMTYEYTIANVMAANCWKSLQRHLRLLCVFCIFIINRKVKIIDAVENSCVNCCKSRKTILNEKKN